jgi:hypothetical protein
VFAVQKLNLTAAKFLRSPFANYSAKDSNEMCVGVLRPDGEPIGGAASRGFIWRQRPVLPPAGVERGENNPARAPENHPHRGWISPARLVTRGERACVRCHCRKSQKNTRGDTRNTKRLHRHIPYGLIIFRQWESRSKIKLGISAVTYYGYLTVNQ